MIEDAHPDNVGGLSAQTIVDLNTKHKDERILFRNRINELVYRLPKIKSKEQWNDEMNFLLLDLERDKNNYKKSFGYLGTGLLNSALAVGVPVLLTAFDNKIWEGGITLLPAISIAAIATITNFNLIKQNRNPSYSSYLIDIEKHTKNIAGAAQQYIHESIND